jgi:hypothetical protein
MTWTEITRREHDRGELRYASDCRDAEWAVIELLMPRPEQGGAAAQDLYAVGVGCDPVHCDDGMPMGPFAEGFSALHDGSVLFLSIARRRRIGFDQ